MVAEPPVTAATRARILRFSLPVLVGLITSGCWLVTDAATRLAAEVVENAALLRAEAAEERTLLHQPRSWPEGCWGEYTVTFQESLHHPVSGGSLLVGCKGTPNFRRLGYNYTTTSHLNAVRVPGEVRVEKEAGAVLRVIIRKQGERIEVVGVQ